MLTKHSKGDEDFKKKVMAESYESLSASPQAQLKFLNDVIGCVVAQKKGGDFFPSFLWDHVLVGSEPFNHTKYFAALESSSLKWNWSEVSRVDKDALVEAVGRLQAFDINYDVGAFIAGFDVLKTPVLTVDADITQDDVDESRFDL